MSVSASATAPTGVTRLGLTAYALGAAAIVIDQITKVWVVDGLHLTQQGMTIPVLPFAAITMVWNRGVSYGLLSAHGPLGRWGLVIFSFVIALGLGFWVRNQTRRLPALAIGLIMGGAVGNALDRARLGYVVDFLDFSNAHFPWVFNVADSCISVGVVLLLLDSFISRKPA
jgi:signal peptidase II